MQISKHVKYFLAIALLIAGFGRVLAQTDTEEAEARAKAREQLNQKMAELESQLDEANQPKPPIATSDDTNVTTEVKPAVEATQPSAEATAAAQADIQAAAEAKAQKAADEAAAADAQAQKQADEKAAAQAQAARAAAEKATADAQARKAAAEKAAADAQAQQQIEERAAAEAQAQKAAAEKAAADAQVQRQIEERAAADAQAQKAAAEKAAADAQARKAAAERAAADAQAQKQAEQKAAADAQAARKAAADKAALEAQKRAAAQASAVVVPQPVVTAPMTKVDSDRIAQARDEERRKMAEMNGGISTPAPVKTSSPDEVVRSTSLPVTIAPVTKVDSDRIAQARQELRRKMVEMQSYPPATVPQTAPVKASAPVVTTTTKPAAPQATSAPEKKIKVEAAPQKVEAEKQALKVSASSATAVSSLPMLQAPQSPISAAKQQQLAELLARYKADKITPEQYHTERAKILAEP